MVEEASRILPGVKFTADLPELNESGKCLVLDLEVWVEKTEDGKAARIRQTSFEKVAALSVFHSKVAYGWRSKIVTLAEEMRHRLKNMDKLHSRKKKTEVQ